MDGWTHPYEVYWPTDGQVNESSHLANDILSERTTPLQDFLHQNRKKIVQVLVNELPASQLLRYTSNDKLISSWRTLANDKEISDYYNRLALQIQLDLMFLFLLDETRNFKCQTNLGGIKNYLKSRKSSFSQTKQMFEDFLLPLMFEHLSQPHTTKLNDAYIIPCLNIDLFIDSKPLYSLLLGVMSTSNSDVSHPLVELVWKLLGYRYTLVESLEEDRINPLLLSRIIEPVVSQENVGAYYTPPNVVNFMAEDIFRRLSWGDSDNSSTTTAEQAVILDPAVGSGHFLVALLDSVCSRRKDVSSNTTGGDGGFIRSFLANGLFGIDRDPQAVLVTRYRLWLRYCRACPNDFYLPNIGANVKVGDALSGLVKLPAHPSPTDISESLTKKRFLLGHLRNSHCPWESLGIHTQIIELVAEELQYLLQVYEIYLSGINELTSITPFHWALEFPSLVSKFCAVVGNPPYLRHEKISHKNAIRSFFRLNHGGKLPPNNADLFTYFVEQTRSLLREGGFLSFLTPQKWMVVRYGLLTKQTLTQDFSVEFLCTFGYSLFPQLDVDSAIVVARLLGESDPPIDREIQALHLRSNQEFTMLVSGESIGLQCQLLNTPQIHENWALLPFFVPSHYQILSHSLITQLMEIMDLRLGSGVNKTGCTRFFYPSLDLVENYSIPAEFLRACAKGPKAIPTLLTSDLNPPSTKASNLVLVVPPEVDPNGLLGPYLSYGASPGFDEPRNPPPLRPSCQYHNRPWYSPPLSPPPDVLIPIFSDKLVRVFLNNAAIYSSDNMIYANFSDPDLPDTHKKMVLACLNSDFGQYFAECYGRSEGGGALHVKKHEAQQLPILSPSAVPDSVVITLSSYFDQLASLDKKAREMRGIRREITVTVLKTLGLTEEIDIFLEAVKNLQLRRLR